MRTFIALLAGFVLLTGCSDPTKSPNTPPPVPSDKTVKPRGTVETVVDGVTGRDAVRQGKRAMNDVRNVSSNKNENLNEIMP